MANSNFTPTVLTIPSTGTTGSGTGEINVVTNPTATTDTSSWTATGLTASRDATGSPLDPVVPTGFSLSATATGQTFVSAALTVPTSLRNRKLKLEFAMSASTAGYKVDVLKSDGTTRFSLTTDASGVSNLPAVTGKYVTYFDMDAGSTVKVRFTSIAGTVGVPVVVKFTQVIVGPGIQPQGAVVDELKTVVLTPNGFGTVSNSAYKAYRIGSVMRVRGRFQAGTRTNVFASLNLPVGNTIDTSKVDTSIYNIVGNFWSGQTGNPYYSTSTNGSLGPVIVDASDSSRVYFSSEAFATNGLIKSTGINIGSDSTYVNFEFEVPVAEWAGSGTVQLAQNDVEYAASTSGTWDAAASAAQTVYGPAGTSITGSLSALRTKIVRFQTPVQVGDKVVLEYRYAGTSTWAEQADTIFPAMTTSGLNYGAHISAISGTDVTITFNQYAYGTSGANWGITGGNWSTSPFDAWRVRKSSAGAAVGFGIVQPGVSSGLVSASGLPGNTTGNAIATGYVGEVKQVFNNTSINSLADTWTYINAILSITKGVWLIGYSAPISDVTGVTGVYGRVMKVTQNADTGDVANSFIYAVGSVAGPQVLSKQFVYYATSDLTSLELRFKTAAAGSMVAGPNISSAITAEDSQTVFYAIRIA